MQRLAGEGIDPQVVDDQIGRITHASDLADGIIGILRSEAPYGVHHVTSPGDPRSWHAIAREAFAAVGADPDRVTAVSTDTYAAGRSLAPRPRNSTLS